MSHSHPGHGSPGAPSAQQAAVQRRAQRILLAVLIPLIAATAVGVVALWPRHVDAAINRDLAGFASGDVTVVDATVAAVHQGACNGAPGSTGAQGQTCTVIEVDSVDPHTSLVLPASITATDVHAGQQVRLYRLDVNGAISYQFNDFERRVPLIWFVAAFVVAIALVARLKGLLALVGLGFAMFMLWKFVLPGLLVGHDPALVGLVGGAAIMVVALYATHGFSIRTTTALMGTLAGLVILAGLSVLAQSSAHLTGITSEDDYQLGAAATHMQLSSVVTAGIIMAGLGVLNDVTITQSSAVWELAATERRRRTIFARAMRIGRDHIASTVYTVAFATAGAATAVLLLAMVSTRQWSDLVRTEVFAEEILRTTVAAIALAAALPVTTAIAVAAVQAGGGFREPPETRALVDPSTPRHATPAEPTPPETTHPRHGAEDLSRFRRPES